MKNTVRQDFGSSLSFSPFEQAGHRGRQLPARRSLLRAGAAVLSAFLFFFAASAAGAEEKRETLPLPRPDEEAIQVGSDAGSSLRDSEKEKDGEDGFSEDDYIIDDDRDDVHTSGGPVNRGGINPSGYVGTLSGYVPARVSQELNWDALYLNSRAGSLDEDEAEERYGEPKYEAFFEDGKLQKLKIEIRYSDGTEVEAIFSGDKKVIRAEYEKDGEEIVFDGSVWRDRNGNEAKGPDLGFMKEYFTKYKTTGMWYAYNTMSLVGHSLRDMFPNLTNKWYQVVPVDLTREGSITYRTAASNLFYFGDCTVTIRDGSVTTDYRLPKGHAAVKSDCLMWFTDIGEITAEFLNNPVGKYQFGQPVSIQDDLKGKEIALLFICNQVTFRDPLTSDGGRLPRYYRSTNPVQNSLKEYEALYEKMLQGSASEKAE